MKAIVKVLKAVRQPNQGRSWPAICALLAGFLVSLPVTAGETPQRIVSLNLCTDQLLLALADPSQIAGLSRFAADERLSFAASQAPGYPQLPAAAEAVMLLEPDLVLTGRFTSAPATHMLTRLGYRVEQVPFVRTLDEARQTIALVADLVGHRERGEALIGALDAALMEGAHEPVFSALLVQRRGYATGTASLTGELLQHFGIRLASDDLVGARGGFADLETIIAADPDILILASLDPPSDDQGSALLAHPALAGRYPPQRRMELPERLTLCAGPSLIEAIGWISEQRSQLATLLPDG